MAKNFFALFKSGLVSLLALAVLLPQAQAQQPIRLGGIFIMSGAASVYGKFAQQGIQLAVDEINAEGGVLGRKLEFRVEDSQGKADVAIQVARKLVFQDRVDALLGLDSSGVATKIGRAHV